MNQLPDYRDQIKYCGYAIYKHNGKKDILIQSKLWNKTIKRKSNKNKTFIKYLGRISFFS